MSITERFWKTISYDRLLSVFGFGMIFFRIPSIGHAFSGNGICTLGMEALFVGALFFFYFSRSTPLFRREVFILLGYAAWVLFLTVCGGNSAIRFLYEYAPVFLLAVYFSIVRTEEDLLRVLRAWITLLTLLLLIDLMTMAVFPGGMYRSENYAENWFLGYKTYRLNVTIPLLVFTAYVQLAESGTVRRSFYILEALVFLDTVFSRGTSASLTVAVFILFTNLFLRYRKSRPVSAARFRRAVFSPFVFEILYGLIIFFILNLRHNQLFIRFMLRVIHKTPTLSGRTLIWEYVFRMLDQSGWVGMGYLLPSQFAEQVHGFNNPHNIVLSLLVYGGIFGFVLFLIFMNCVFLRCGRNDCNVVVMLALYSFMLLGIASSSFVTAPLFYCLFMLLMAKQNHGTPVTGGRL